MLIKQLPSEGAWLFRYRSYLPIAFLPILIHAALMLDVGKSEMAFTTPWNLGCLVVSLLGLAVRILTVGFVTRNTSGRNTREQRADELNTTGLYSAVRHPLYVGNFLIWLGICLTVPSLEVILLFVCAYWLYYERIMAAEEQFLADKFGSSYQEWADRTPAFIPRLTHWQRPSLSFCWRTILTREYCGVLGIGFAFAVINVGQNWILNSVLQLDTLWAAILGATVLNFLVLRTLKKKRIIQVPGRC